MKKIAVVLSGCGFLDGAEITEAISTLIALSQNGAAYEIFAPEKDLDVVNHLTGKPTSEKRSVLQESARIARGAVKNLKDLDSENFDAVVFPGGYGAAKNLSDWAFKGSKAQVLESVEKTLLSFYESSKPIAVFCIAPTLAAKVLGSKGITLTIGNDAETAKEIEKTGATHEACAVDDFITDRAHKIISSPAYMYDKAHPHEVFMGISKAIKELVEMA
jgi:enhancing lycopene biosynthesis protein 2